jgi:hypothetical protein
LLWRLFATILLISPAVCLFWINEARAFFLARKVVTTPARLALHFQLNDRFAVTRSYEEQDNFGMFTVDISQHFEMLLICDRVVC